MAITGINSNNYSGYMKTGAVNLETEKKSSQNTVSAETASEKTKEDTFVKSEKYEKVGYEAPKKLSSKQVDEINKQRTENMRNFVSQMIGKQVEASGNNNSQNEWMQQLLGPQDTPETAAEAISKDGEWGIDAVATRLMDMAVALAGGDNSKISELRGAVEDGFKAAGAVIGDELPSVCQDTYTETMKRFDYWEENGTMDGYNMEE